MACRLLFGILCLLMHGVVTGGEDQGAKVLDAMLGAAPAPPPSADAAPAPPPLKDSKGDGGDGDGGDGDSGDGDGGDGDGGPTTTIDPHAPTTPPPVIAADAPACASNIASFIFKVTRIARFLTLATTDCAQPGQVGAVCGDEITRILRYAGEGAAAISAATFDCGTLDSSCAQLISAAVGHLSAATEKLVTLELACFDDLSCMVKVFDFMSMSIHAAKDIDTAIGQCKAVCDETKGACSDSPAPPAPAPPPLADLEEKGSAPAPPPLRLLLHGSLAGHGGLRRPVVSEASSPDVLPANAQGME